jgi:hypothetical protein
MTLLLVIHFYLGCAKQMHFQSRMYGIAMFNVKMKPMKCTSLIEIWYFSINLSDKNSLSTADHNRTITKEISTTIINECTRISISPHFLNYLWFIYFSFNVSMKIWSSYYVTFLMMRKLVEYFHLFLVLLM